MEEDFCSYLSLPFVAWKATSTKFKPNDHPSWSVVLLAKPIRNKQRESLTFNELKILYYVRSIKRYKGSRNHLQELVNIDGGSFDLTMDRLIGTYLEEGSEGLKVTEVGEKAIRFLRVPNYVLFAMYIIGAGALILGVTSLFAPLAVLRLLPLSLILLGAVGIGGDLAFYTFARNYAKEFLRTRDKPLFKV